MNKKQVLRNILIWLKGKKGVMDEDFCCDFHINRWSNIESKTEWLPIGLEMYNLLLDNIKNKYPQLKVMIAFYLSSTSKTKIPKSLSKRNFKKKVYTPPVIFLYSNKIKEKDIIGESVVFLNEISEKYNMKAYYSETKEDVIYRTIFMFE